MERGIGGNGEMKTRHDPGLKKGKQIRVWTEKAKGYETEQKVNAQKGKK